MRGPIVPLFIITGLAALAIYVYLTLYLPQQPAEEGVEEGPVVTLPLEGVRRLIELHIRSIESLDVDSVMKNYAPGASMKWTGEAGGLEGVYSGRSQIKALWNTILGQATRLSLTLSDYEAEEVEPGRAIARIKIGVKGFNTLLGRFEGEIDAVYEMQVLKDRWEIVSELWDFDYFTAEGRGATTFPQWRFMTESVEDELSDPVKGFFWEMSGYSPAILASLPLLVMLYTLRRRSIR